MGGKGPAIKQKIIFEIICCPCKKNLYMIKFIVGQQILCLLKGLLKYLPRNISLLVQKFGGGERL